MNPFESAKQKVIDDDLRFRRVSPLKASSDRRHRAWLEFEIDGWGDAWTRLFIMNKSGDTVYESPLLYSHPSVRGWNATRRTLRGIDTTTVTVDHWPLDEPFGPKQHIHRAAVSS